MKVLVEGATGAIGRPLIKSLTRAGHAPFGMVRSQSFSVSLSDSFESVRRQRFSCRFEIAKRERQRDGSERDPGKDAEAVHKSQQANLMLELVKNAVLRR